MPTPTLYTVNGAALRASDGALVANPCATIADPCVCGDACSATTTNYTYYSCCNNGVGYNHACWAVFGTVARNGCHSDCCHENAPVSRSFPRPEIIAPPDYGTAYHINVGGIDVGAGSSDLCGKQYSYSTPARYRWIGGAALVDGACEARLDSHLVNPDSDPDHDPRELYLKIGGTYFHSCWFPVEGNTGLNQWTVFPFFHTISAGTSSLTFLQTTTCNAGSHEEGGSIEHGWHQFTWHFASAAGLWMVVSLDGVAIASIANGQTADVTRRFAQPYTGPEFTLTFAVSAA